MLPSPPPYSASFAYIFSIFFVHAPALYLWVTQLRLFISWYHASPREIQNRIVRGARSRQANIVSLTRYKIESKADDLEEVEHCHGAILRSLVSIRAPAAQDGQSR